MRPIKKNRDLIMDKKEIVGKLSQVLSSSTFWEIIGKSQNHALSGSNQEKNKEYGSYIHSA
jgi:hypothetical protein